MNVSIDRPSLTPRRCALTLPTALHLRHRTDHSDCVKVWLSMSKLAPTCPLCKQDPFAVVEVELTEMRTPSEGADATRDDDGASTTTAAEACPRPRAAARPRGPLDVVMDDDLELTGWGA